MGEVPDSLPVTDEARERLREQANQLPAATVVRLIDLLAVAVDDMRQGGDPRLPLELALVKVTRPGVRPLARVAWPSASSGSRQGTCRAGDERRVAVSPSAEVAADPPAEAAAPPLRVELEQLQEAWRRSILPAVERALDPDRQAARARRTRPRSPATR